MLKENAGVSYMGTTKVGAFHLPGDTAWGWLELPTPNERSNREVVKRRFNGLDVTRRARDVWIMDFGVMPETEAAGFVVPYEYIKERIKPLRDENKRASYREKWWLHGEPRPALRAKLAGLERYIATPSVAKHRLFVWLDRSISPDHQLFVFTRADAFTFGVLHSRLNEVWSLAMGTSLEDRPRYTPTTCFETSTFPYPDKDRRTEVERWATYLDEVRAQLLSADGSRTMTGLYNDLAKLRETRDAKSLAYPLLLAHEKLDAAVAAAYGWTWPLTDDEILAALLALNLERSAVPTFSLEPTSASF